MAIPPGDSAPGTRWTDTTFGLYQREEDLPKYSCISSFGFVSYTSPDIDAQRAQTRQEGKANLDRDTFEVLARRGLPPREDEKLT